MANNKVNYSKTKGREDKSKTTKGSGNNSDDTDDLDCSLLRRPIHTSITGFAQARKIFDFATEELKELLSNECDLLYECKLCRNLFRSLVNFISHKRIYCKEKFNGVNQGNLMNNNLVANELSKIKALEEAYQESLKNKTKIENADENERIPFTKDLSSILEKIVASRGVQEKELEQQQVVLQNIPKTSVAVYQNILYNNNKNDDMRTQVQELDTMLSKECAVLQSDGNFKIESHSVEPESVIQISDEDDNSADLELKCKMCDQQFSTQKTLKSHMKTKHVETRLVYPCPDCLEIFSTSWSVYRHLFKVHRKTAAQIRRLRESIQAKAFRMNNPPAFYEKRKANAKSVTPQKISEEDRLEQENQAWMDNMEGDGELPRCGGCGRTFERRAALAAHTNTCQPRSRALARRPQETKKIEIQIRKDYHKGPPNINLQLKSKDNNTNEETQPLSKDQPQQEQKCHENTLTEAIMSIVGVNSNDNDENETAESDDQNGDINQLKPVHKLPYSHQAEKSNFNMLKQKVLQNTEIDNLLCKKCDTKFKEINELFDHVATHYKWMRYACKLCNFKHYEFEKVPEHVKIVHKLKGDSEFYCSTVKAINGAEASELGDCNEEQNETNETSPVSRRLSRCSSDSSRLSDDSSSSTSRVEIGSRKRKNNSYRFNSKKKKESGSNSGSKDSETSPQKDILLADIDSSSNSRGFEENSSDIDDSDEKIAKTPIKINEPISTGRPVRKRTKPVNEDFLYDLSTLLKKEAQGHRESLTVTNVKSGLNKKKSQDNLNNFKSINKDCCGALYTLSKKSNEGNKAHMKIEFPPVVNITKEQRISNIFVRPMLPKISRIEKNSPVKDDPENSVDKDIVELNEPTITKTAEPADITIQSENKNIVKTVEKNTNDNVSENSICVEKEELVEKSNSNSVEKNLNVPAVVPIKLHNKSLDLIRNPLIKKNISEFTKAGMKTKILVIKPINRKDGTKTINAPLKFQTIKLKDPKLSTSNEEKKSDQVVVVQVPKVDCVVPRSVLPTQNVENAASNIVIPTVLNNNIIKTLPDTDKRSICNNHEPVTKSETNPIKVNSEITNDTKCLPEEIQSDVEIIFSNAENSVLECDADDVNMAKQSCE